MIQPLSEKQLEALPQEMDRERKPFRVMSDGMATNICTGHQYSKGSNIMYHPLYWDRPRAFLDAVLCDLKKNNPNVIFKVSYH